MDLAGCRPVHSWPGRSLWHLASLCQLPHLCKFWTTLLRGILPWWPLSWRMLALAFILAHLEIRGQPPSGAEAQDKSVGGLPLYYSCGHTHTKCSCPSFQYI